MTAAWGSQADSGLATTALECADLAPKFLGYIVRSHATPLDHLWDCGEHCLRQNYASHIGHLFDDPGSMVSRAIDPFGSISGYDCAFPARLDSARPRPPQRAGEALFAGANKPRAGRQYGR